MKCILVPLEDSPVLPSVLETAFLTAKRFDGHIDVLQMRATLSGVMAVGLDGFAATPSMVESFEQSEQERSRRARKTYEEFVRGKRLDEGGAAAPDIGLSINLAEETLPSHEVVGSRARVYDLTVVGRPVPSETSPTMSLLEAALFESGRPILIAPPKPPTDLGDRIVVAWNGSTETARAVSCALPFLTHADEVVVLSVENGMVPGPSGEEAAAHLQRHDVPARAVQVAGEGKAPGPVLLDESAALGADLLVKGAYTHSRLRQMIFGGATSHILSNAELPVLMSH
ncbi:MAG: universal stress protein [Alphaproteobacteria bacterium]